MNRIQFVLLAVVSLSAGACASAPTADRHPSPFPMAATDASGDRRDAAPQIAAVVNTALALRGTRYQLGGSSPETGFDCSGLVRYVFLQQTIDLPRTVAGQARSGRHVDRTRIAPGDLVFFSTTGRGATHVGIALDAERFIHAPDAGAVVRVERLDTPYWARRYTGSRRVL